MALLIVVFLLPNLSDTCIGNSVVVHSSPIIWNAFICLSYTTITLQVQLKSGMNTFLKNKTRLKFRKLCLSFPSLCYLSAASCSYSVLRSACACKI